MQVVTVSPEFVSEVLSPGPRYTYSKYHTRQTNAFQTSVGCIKILRDCVQFNIIKVHACILCEA